MKAGEEELAQAGEKLESLVQRIGTVIVGMEEVVEGALVCLLAGGHCLLEGLPGLGKTMLVRTLAESLDLRFSRVQFTPDLMPADITGTMLVTEEGGARRFQFEKGPIFANIVLADEINRATPKTQSALLEAMQEGRVTVAGTGHPLPQPFLVLATQNPIEMEGTYPLPEAQLDRFLLKLHVPFPTGEQLRRIIDQAPQAVSVSPVLSAAPLEALRALARQVPAAEHVKDYAVSLTLATHPGRPGAAPLAARYVRYGASPRGALALVAAAKARALLQGRPCIGVDDIRAVAPAALRHRLILNFEAESDGVDADKIVADVLEKVAPLPQEA